jgi:uncharacterized membrane protein YidH (DUF202 family)
MKAKAPRMFGLRGTSPSRVVQGLFLFLIAIILNDFCCKYMLNVCEQLNLICIMHEHDIIIYISICMFIVTVNYDCMCLYVNFCMWLYVIYDCICTCI